MDLRELPRAPFSRHPWEAARASFFTGVVRESTPGGAPVSVLDVGAGDGYLARRLLESLPPSSRVTCVDPNYSAEHLDAFSRDAPPGLAFAREPPGTPVDWLLLLDVLEHVPDDRATLEELARRCLRPGGRALVSVPAWPALYTEHDALLGHFRRYRPAELDRLIEGAGLERQESGSLFSSLLAPRLAAKIGERLRGRVSVPVKAVPDAAAETAIAAWSGGRAVSAMIRTALVMDGRAGRALSRAGLRVPGLSVWAAARLPEARP